MTYLITLSNGSRTIPLSDNSIDTTSTSLTLVGRNYAGYGQAVATDLVHLLENFSSSISPANPIVGQMWFNTTNSTLNICTQITPSIVWTTMTTSVAGLSGAITAQQLQQSGLAPIASPTFTGIPSGPTPDGTQSQQLATVGYVSNNFPTSNSPTFTGIPSGPTPDGTHSQQFATVGYVQSEIASVNVRIRLTANTSFFVATTGSDSNNGLSSGTAWATLQHAYNAIQQNYDLNGFTATINVAAGTYVGVHMRNPIVGQNGPGFLEWAGVGATSIINADSSGVGAFYGSMGAQAYIHGFKVQNSNNSSVDFAPTGWGIYADTSYFVVNNITFGGCGQTQLYAANHATIGVTGASSTFAVTGNATAFCAAEISAYIGIPDSIVTFSNPVTYSSAVMLATLGGTLDIHGITYVNGSNVSGCRFVSDIFGAVTTQTNVTTTIPGTIAGSLNPSGAGAYYN